MSRILKSALVRAKSQAVKRGAILGSEWKRLNGWKWFPDTITSEMRLNAGVRVVDILEYGTYNVGRGRLGDYLVASQCFILLHAMNCERRLQMDMLVDQLPEDVSQMRLTNDWDDWFPHCVALRVESGSNAVTTSDVRRYIFMRLVDHDAAKYLEAAQCAALLHFLGNPSILTVIDEIQPEYDECHDI